MVRVGGSGEGGRECVVRVGVCGEGGRECVVREGGSVW